MMGLFSTKAKIEKKDRFALKVLEAYTADVSGGVARIDKNTMMSLGVSEGDILEIEGSRITPAKCLMIYPSDEGSGIIRIDGLTRNNAGVEIGSTVTIKKSEAKKGEIISVVPLEACPPVDEQYIIDSLDGTPLVKGDNLMVPYFGGRVSYQVIQTVPPTIVLVTKKTLINIKDYIPEENPEKIQPEDDSNDNRFLDVAKERYAKGEITRDEFLQMKKDLS